MERRNRSGGPNRTVAVPEDEAADLWRDGTPEAVRALLVSAVLCFSGKGFHATTTRDITAAVGLSPGALYVHFPSKEDVLFEIVRTGHERALAAMTAQSDEGDPVDHVRRLVAAHVAWHARHHTVARVCQYELAALAPGHHAEVLELRHRFSELVHSAVTRGARSGAFDVPDVDRAVRAVLSLGIDLVRWYRLDGDDSPEALGAFYAGLALRMIGAHTA
ncbi:TetR/AcrR family transcriptional regulator [Actinophytocola algeriensis]|uniref:AcrR family transcriptional regulator n=1 Tax=Actinophytocola algeriensis TaxID=1768010 RepID=A0A7W7VIL2_9PSEU|nr:TetR/AcrR family transcriptional regulator [Actinophytocola algeriensis]MBB4911682.1 AcrR family transcriptional regulator [Actinophytocola algeriensis]MBE1473330.1 AcrR family transcriptional regulator [Actinophytocola algeriensis]